VLIDRVLRLEERKVGCAGGKVCLFRSAFEVVKPRWLFRPALVILDYRDQKYIELAPDADVE
jgi:hypothetical protein